MHVGFIGRPLWPGNAAWPERPRDAPDDSVLEFINQECANMPGAYGLVRLWKFGLHAADHQSDRSRGILFARYGNTVLI